MDTNRNVNVVHNQSVEPKVHKQDDKKSKTKLEPIERAKVSEKSKTQAMIEKSKKIKN